MGVDDIVIAATSMKIMNFIKDMLKGRFKMKDLGKISNFLGIEFTQEEGLITMCQSNYLKCKLEKYGFLNAKSRTTPCEQRSGYVDNVPAPDGNYREMVGSLIYAMSCTRPDLSWVVSKLSQHLANPCNADYVMVKHVFKYVLGTLDLKLIFKKSKNLELTAFCDADWGSCKEDRRSYSGYCFMLNEEGPVISWKTKKQPTVALSSCEAEYMAMALAIQEALYLKRLLGSIGNTVTTSIKVDNQGAMAVAKNPSVNHQRSKHIDIRYHFVKEVVDNQECSLQYVPSVDNIADIMTKPCSKVKLLKFRNILFGMKSVADKSR